MSGVMMTGLRAWMRQPTTVAGFSTLAGTGMGMLSGTITWQAAVPILLGAAVAIVMPDNSAAQQTVARTAVDAIAAVAAVRAGGDAGSGKAG